jgi:flagellar assembly factor FliW
MNGAGSLVAGGELHFPAGLVGLPDLRRFAVQAVEDTGLVELVSLDDPSFGFVAALGDDVREGMSGALQSRGVLHGEDRVLVFLSVHGDPPEVTANLAGPIVVSPDGSAQQVVLEDPEFPLRAPVGPAL